MLKNTVCGGNKVAAGAVIDATPEDARKLTRAGKAEEHTEPKKRRKKTTPVNRMVATDELVNRGIG